MAPKVTPFRYKLQNKISFINAMNSFFDSEKKWHVFVPGKIYNIFGLENKMISCLFDSFMDVIDLYKISNIEIRSSFSTAYCSTVKPV